MGPPLTKSGKHLENGCLYEEGIMVREEITVEVQVRKRKNTI